MDDKLFYYFSALCEKNRLPEEEFRKDFPFLFEKDAPARIKALFDLLLSEPKEILPGGLFYYKKTLHPNAFFAAIKHYADENGADAVALYFPLYLLLSFYAAALHEKAGIPKSISDDTLSELVLWGKKHRSLTGAWGLYDYFWCAKYIGGELLRIGSLEYQLCENPIGEKGGLCENEAILKIHIPAGCDFSRAARRESYRAALAFYAPRLARTKLSFLCESWLLSRDHAALSPSNIADFRGDFTILEEYSDRDCGFLWRIFGACACACDTKNAQALPHDNRLRTLYREKLLKNEPFSSALGVFTLSL